MRNILITALAILVVVGILLVGMGMQLAKKAKLVINTEPISIVTIDGKQMGQTPFEGVFRNGEHVVNLTPVNNTTGFETRADLASNVTTVINRIMGADSSSQSGEIISFEKSGEVEASISVVTDPDAAALFLNGQARGYSPLRISGVIPGQQSLTINSPGYIERKIDLQTVAGYKITLVAKLARDPNYKAPDLKETLAASTETTTAEEGKLKIKILETGTGFLRVREAANIGSKEVGQVKPGEEYELISESDDGKWFQIDGGWINGEFVSKTVEDADDESGPKNN